MSKITFAKACEIFDESCNDNEEIVTVNGLQFLPADVMKEMDPIGYKDAVYDFAYELEYEIVTRLSRYDKVQLIVEHMVNQGIEDSEQFYYFLTRELFTFSESELDEKLESLEANAV